MKTAVAKKAPAHIGRPPIFDNEARALQIIKEESEHCRKRRKPCTLSSLSAEVATDFRIYLLDKKERDEIAKKKEARKLAGKKPEPVPIPRGFKKVASDDAMKQAIYKLVCKHNLWLSARAD